NNGAYTASYSLTPTCGAFTVCKTDKGAVTLTPGARDSAHVSFLVPTAIGSFSPIQLVARYTAPTSGAVADTGRVTVNTPTAFDLYQPRVIALFPTMLVQPGYVANMPFTVTNLGTDTVTYALTTTYT